MIFKKVFYTKVQHFGRKMKEFRIVEDTERNKKAGSYESTPLKINQ